MADDQLSRVFAALADPTRRDMVARLAVTDATVGQLADPYDVSLQAVPHNIGLWLRLGWQGKGGHEDMPLPCSV